MKSKILVFVLFLTSILSAQNFNDALRLSFQPYGIGARALGMGGAFIGVSDDYTATAYNPAGLFQLKRMEFHGGINYLSYDNNTTFFGNQSTFNTSSVKLTDLGFVFPFPVIRGSLVFAFGFNRSNNFNDALAFEGFNDTTTSMIKALLGRGDVSYLLYLTDSTGDYTPINGRLYQSGSILSSGSVNNWVFSGAIEVAKNLSIGATIGIVSGEFERNRDYSEEDVNNIYDSRIRTDPVDPRTADFELFRLQETLKWELTGFAAKLGLMYRVSDMMRFGTTIKFPTIYTIKEHYLVDGYSRFGTGFSADIDPPLESKIEYEIWSPFEFGVGFSVSKFGLTISGDMNLIDYTQMEFKGLSPSKTARNNRDIKQLFKSVMDYNLGAEYNILQSGLRLRAGYFVKNSPFKDDPSDFNRKYLTLGIGYITPEGFSLDLAYVRGTWKNIGDNYDSGVSRTYQSLKTTDIVFTTSFRF
ncbi:MAG: outer membrane protein transport protein [Ignavibacteria bacterium]|jgi:long-subunit fatty acid transport protein|nr:outer membrane protein transport protein [Ignavibacteria bacterium]MDH7527272.1 outer membrane protein transport protein [Ignavibacteria bacterium]